MMMMMMPRRPPRRRRPVSPVCPGRRSPMSRGTWSRSAPPTRPLVKSCPRRALYPVTSATPGSTPSAAAVPLLPRTRWLDQVEQLKITFTARHKDDIDRGLSVNQQLRDAAALKFPQLHPRLLKKHAMTRTQLRLPATCRRVVVRLRRADCGGSQLRCPPGTLSVSDLPRRLWRESAATCSRTTDYS